MKLIQNSKLAKAKNKKEDVVKIKSSLILPPSTTLIYNTTHSISEYNVITSKLLQLSNKNTIDNQNSIKKNWKEFKNK